MGEVDFSIRHGLEHSYRMFKGNIAFRSHEGRNHAFGVLLSFALGDVADNDTDNDLYVIFCGWISYKPPDVIVDVESMYLRAKQARVFSKIRSQENDETIRIISCSLKMFEHNKERNLVAWGPLFIFGNFRDVLWLFIQTGVFINRKEKQAGNNT